MESENDKNYDFFLEDDYEEDPESAELWFSAISPNYNRNTNKFYPYSETPTFSSFNLIKIPASLNELLDHIDYWGEGRVIDSMKQISGFANCYNVNYQYKIVSSGPDKNKKIPNRIPIASYTNCDTSRFIKSNSVKLVTVNKTTTSKINESCAKDIARIVNNDFGKVIIMGYNNDAEELKYIEQELQDKGLVYYEGYELPEIFKELTVINNARSYISVNALKEQLYNDIKEASYASAVKTSKVLYKGTKLSVSYIIQKLLNERSKNVLPYAYQLWANGGTNIVSDSLPQSFADIFKQDPVMIFDTKLKLYLKMNQSFDSSNRKVVYGDYKNQDNSIFCWRLVAEWKESSVFFKIINENYLLYLTLDVEKNVFEERQAQGEAELKEERFIWYLEPILKKNKIFFRISNRQFKQILKLDLDKKDENGRILWGQENYYGYDYFTWNILPCNQ